MKKFFKKTNNFMKKLANFWLLISIAVIPTFTFYKVDAIDQRLAALEQKVKRPVIKYYSDSVGGIGYVSVKDGNVITVPGYGQFLLNDSESAIIQVGDKVPGYILKRGN